MKRHIISFYSVVMLSLILLVGCQHEAQYKFLQESSEIKEIQIVALEQFNQQKGEWNNTVQCVIEDREQFLAEFNQIDCYEQYTHPLGLMETTAAIKICYYNGDYEIISADGRGTYTQAQKFENYKGWVSLNKEQFMDFLNRYTK